MQELTQLGQDLLELRGLGTQAEKQRVFKRSVSSARRGFLWRHMIDPFITYGITKVESGATPTPMSWEELEHLLDALKRREVSGNQAKALVNGLFAALPTPEAKLAWRSLIMKYPNCGVSLKSIRKWAPGLIRDWSIMLATAEDQKRINKLLEAGPVIVEPKYDGERRVTIIDNGLATMFTRPGHVDDHFPEALKELAECGQDSLVLDGELYPVDNNFNRLASITSSADVFDIRAENLQYILFDILTLKEWETRETSTPLWKRKEMLRRVSDRLPNFVSVAPVSVCHTEEEINREFDWYTRHDMEGVVIKSYCAPYQWRKSPDWVKKKIGDTVDLVIQSVLPGDPGKQYENSLGRMLATYNGVEVAVSPGKMSRELRQRVWDDRDLYVGRTIEVAYQTITPHGSLLFPRFIRFRPDKD